MGSTGGACAPNETMCDGGCVDTQTDTAHCGGCGNLCGPDGWTCDMGACAEMRTWQAPVALSPAGVDGADPDAAADDAGNAHVVWAEDGAETGARRYDGAGNTWQAPTTVDGSTSAPRIALDRPSGAGWGTWLGPGVPVDIVRGAPVDAMGWETAIDISMPADASTVTPPKVAADGNHAVALWIGPMGNEDRLLASRFDGQNWTAPQAMDWSGGTWLTIPAWSDEYEVAYGPGTDFAVVVWTQADGGPGKMQLNANGFGGPEVLANLPGDASDPTIGIDGSNRAIVAWRQEDGNKPETAIYAIHYENGWGAPVPLAADPMNNYYGPKIAVTPSGDAMVVYGEIDAGTDERRLWAQFYDFDTDTWTPAMLLDQAQFDIADWNVAVDDAGNAVVVWRRSDVNPSVNDAVARRYARVANAWGPVVALENAPGTAIRTDVAMDGAGNAIAIWQQHDGANFRIYGSWYR
ncbi:MAG: hypothetical protein D6705_13735 [Deltaproteobacteria bacterium]|nr:MAG: hypothetical protein D6705_13735 [Deltaproteobacteria bacterium]